MTLFRWSRVKDTNNTADSTCPFPEGQSPSSLNDGSRGQMAAVAKFRDDISGAILTGGTSAAYTVSSYQGFDTLANLHNQMIGFTPHTSNVDTVLLNVDGLGLKPLRSAPGVELLKSTLVQGTPYVAVYNNTDAVFYLQGYYSSPYNVPFLGGIEYWDTVAPNSAFIFPMGQALSRTTYAAAFARWGTTYGAGDGSTTFNVPDKTGRVSAMKETTASRLTSGVSGVDGATMGSAGGGQSHTQTLNETPIGIQSSNAAFSISAVSPTNGVMVPVGGSGVGSGSPFLSYTSGTVTSTGTVASSAVTSTSTNTGGQAHAILQPTIVCNYIIRIV